MKEQENFDQDEMVLRQLLGLFPDRVYPLNDLADNEVLEGSLRLWFRVRFGQAKVYTGISPHITYDNGFLDEVFSEFLLNSIHSGKLRYIEILFWLDHGNTLFLPSSFYLWKFLRYSSSLLFTYTLSWYGVPG